MVRPLKHRISSLTTLPTPPVRRSDILQRVSAMPFVVRERMATSWPVEVYPMVEIGVPGRYLVGVEKS